MRDTIDMARKADEYADMEWPLRPRGERWQKCRDERFEALVRADEREACAKVCDDLAPPCGYNLTETSFWDVTSLECAAAIRARGETK
jgi:hypothetical protein